VFCVFVDSSSFVTLTYVFVFSFFSFFFLCKLLVAKFTESDSSALSHKVSVLQGSSNTEENSVDRVGDGDHDLAITASHAVAPLLSSY
jgi:hypothetical protein